MSKDLFYNVTNNIEEIKPPKISNSLNTENYSYLGDLERIKVSTQHYLLNNDNSQAVKDLETSNLIKIDDDGRYSFDPKEGTELGNIVKNIYQIQAFW